nr:hypothetical protein Iba_scaffold64990CG0010 [Ipomoea batatas]
MTIDVSFGYLSTQHLSISAAFFHRLLNTLYSLKDCLLTYNIISIELDVVVVCLTSSPDDSLTFFPDGSPRVGNP